MRTLLTIIVALLISVPAAADPYCDALMSLIHDVSKAAVATHTVADRSGPLTVAQTDLPGARCIVSPYNPTGVEKDHPAEQSVYCFWSTSEDGYRQLFDDTNTRIAGCLAQTPTDTTFITRLEYDNNYGVVRISADQMTSDWAVSVTVMPQN